jgi:hypothetical protein
MKTISPQKGRDKTVWQAYRIPKTFTKSDAKINKYMPVYIKILL